MRHYGIYNTYRKCFQFRISEATPEEAKAKLKELISDAADKDKFEARIIPKKEAKNNANTTPTK